MSDDWERLCAYSLTHTGAEFIHQHVVDAYGAQNATGTTRPIQLTFALVGLCLYAERGWTGREVQRLHARLAAQTKSFPTIDLPEARGAVTVRDVVDAPEGDARDAAISRWCRAVWAAYAESRPSIVAWLASNGIPAAQPSPGRTP